VVNLIDNQHRWRRCDQESRHQGDASPKALLQGWERAIDRRNKLNRIILDLTVRGMKIPIPYLTEDGEAMRRQGDLSIHLKDLFVENQPSSALCPRMHNVAILRIVCASSVPTFSRSRKKCVKESCLVTQGRKISTHMPLCQVDPVADHVKARDKLYTLSQPHRFICAILHKRIEQVRCL